MKSKLFALASIVLFVALQLVQSRLGVPISQMQLNSASTYRVALPLVFRPGTAATPTSTNTSTKTLTLSTTFTATNSPTATITGTLTETDTPTNTATWTNTPTGTLTLTDTPTSTPTFTNTPTHTLTLTNTPTATATSSPTLAGKLPLYRFGVSLGRSMIPFFDYSSYDITSMRFGWYVDYHVSANAPTPDGVEYMPTIHVKQLKLAADGVTKVTCRPGDDYVIPAEYTVSPSLAEIQSVASNRPGMTWLVGNEIERRDWGSDSSCGGQDEITPELYAQAYHDIYAVIKAADPTAKVANGSLVEFTPLRQTYLDRVWAEYSRLAGLNGWTEMTMPVDVWNMHFFALREKSCAYYPTDCWGAAIPAGLSDKSGVVYSDPFAENWEFTNLWTQVLLLRTWMASHGQKDKPLITSEFGANYAYYYYSCYDSSDNTACPVQLRDSMMYPSFDAFLNQTDATIGDSQDGNRLVQRWAWWSMDFDTGFCDGGVYYENFVGALFDSGLGPLTAPYDCTFPARGMSYLGSYWKQYVQNLP